MPSTGGRTPSRPPGLPKPGRAPGRIRGPQKSPPGAIPGSASSGARSIKAASSARRESRRRHLPEAPGGRPPPSEPSRGFRGTISLRGPGSTLGRKPHRKPHRKPNARRKAREPSKPAPRPRKLPLFRRKPPKLRARRRGARNNSTRIGRSGRREGPQSESRPALPERWSIRSRGPRKEGIGERSAPAP